MGQHLPHSISRKTRSFIRMYLAPYWNVSCTSQSEEFQQRILKRVLHKGGTEDCYWPLGLTRHRQEGFKSYKDTYVCLSIPCSSVGMKIISTKFIFLYSFPGRFWVPSVYFKPIDFTWRNNSGVDYTSFFSCYLKDVDNNSACRMLYFFPLSVLVILFLCLYTNYSQQ
jgi:hypothetical protein